MHLLRIEFEVVEFDFGLWWRIARSVSNDRVADIRACGPGMGSRSLRTVDKFPIPINDGETLGLFDKILSSCF